MSNLEQMGLFKESDQNSSPLAEEQKDIIREKIRAKLRLEARGEKQVFTPEELQVIEEDRREDMESRDLSGH